MSNTQKEHQEANDFALDLLMPADHFREKVNSGITNVGELAEYYGVSAMAVRHRARTLGMSGHNVGEYRKICLSTD